MPATLSSLTFFVAVLASLILPLVAGFQVTFYLGNSCHGARWGTGHYRYPGTPDVCHNVPTNAVSATITREDTDGDDYNIAFWSGGCGRVLVGSGDGGECITFGSKGAQFSVREDWTVPGKKRGLSPAWAAEQQQHRDRLKLTAETAKGSLSPYFDPDMLARAGFGHGAISEESTGLVRWHQIALGIAVAVPIDEWDDTIHVKSDRFVPYGNAYDSGRYQDHDCGTGNTLASRSPVCEAASSESPAWGGLAAPAQWRPAQCRAAISCARDIAGAVSLRMHQGWPQVVECAVKAQRWGESLWDRLSWGGKVACWIFNNGVSFGLGTIDVGGGGGTADENEKLTQCSTEHSQANAFVEAILGASLVPAG
ncbi:hypothetical protein B0T16DRAFT_393336 [Cercophora newfieldiana]|uniref:Uncharacterized protein n=1 Tax=Cercophora newfieldiana TaxID=92897 RepID=A0AA39XVE8_9PEZI|nr:hypothetical protein B0T16DRAFT_393336 [Cercophora newfieldiana]